MVQRVHKVQQIGSLFYLQRNVRASWLALRMITFGLYLPNIQSSCVIARCLNNKHNVFFVAEKTCRNVAVLISNCDSMTMSKKLKILLTFPDYTAGDPVRKIFIKRRFTDSKDRLSRESSGHASVPYNRMGKHSACSKTSTHSSEAARPTLP